MSYVYYECLYCGKKDKEYMYKTYGKPTCSVCGDKNVRQLDKEEVAKSDVFGYEVGKK